MDASQVSMQLADIQRVLGTLLAESKQNAEDQRETNEQIVRVHERIDGMREDMDGRFRQLEMAVSGNDHLATETAAALTELSSTINVDIRPQTEEFRRIRAMGSGFLFAVGIAGTIMGMTFSDVLKAFLSAIRRTIA
jgi:hypothetical protein